MPNDSYLTRTIHNSNGKELDNDSKLAFFQLSTAIIDELMLKDESTQRLNAYMVLNKNYNNNNLNIDRPVNEWTNNEILEKIRSAKREASLGRVGFFEAGDRVRNFRTRKTLSDFLMKEMGKVRDARTNSIVDACIGAAADGAPIQMKNSTLSDVAINWIPYLMRQKRSNGNHLLADFPSLEPTKVFRNLNEGNPESLVNLMDMLQMIEDTDMEEFSYTDNQSFAANFAVKYEKLKALAEGENIIEYLKLKNNSVLKTKRSLNGGNEDSIKVTIAKSKLAKEMLRDYENRMNLISSPYYALLAGKDFEKMDTRRVMNLKKGPGHKALDAYLNEVIEYKNIKANSFKGVNVTDKLNTYILGVQPAPAPIVKLPSEKTLEEIERLIQKMYADTKRASSYRAAREAFRKYLQAETNKAKIENRIAAVNAAATYLATRNESSYKHRKDRCEDLIILYNKYLRELNEEQKEAQAKQEKINEENQRQQVAHVALENELRNKAADMSQRIAEKKAREKEEREERERLEAIQKREREERERLETERIRKEREDELKKLSDSAEAKAANWRREREEEAAMIEAEEKALAALIREKKIFIETLNLVISKYDELGKLGKTARDSEETRKLTEVFLDKYVFKDGPKEDIDIIPTAMLVDVIKAHAVDTDNSDFAKLIRADLKKLGWNNSPVYAEYRKTINAASNKKMEEITEKDRLSVYEYSIHMLHYAAGAEKLTFESLRDMDLKKLGSLALHHANMAEGSPEENVDDAAAILSIFTGADAEEFKYLLANDISAYASDALKFMAEPEKHKKILDECIGKVNAIKKKQTLLVDAIRKFEDLGKAGKTAEDSKEAREAVLSFLDEYIFKEDKNLDDEYTNEQLVVVPTNMLINSLKKYASEFNKPEFEKLIKADICGQIWSNTESYDGFKNPLKDVIKKKPEEMTELEKLNVYEYSIHVLYYATDVEDLDFDSLKDIDISRLGTLAWHTIRLDEGLPDKAKKETFDSISQEMRELHKNEAANILSLFSNVDPEEFKYLSVEDISKYAYKALEYITEPDKQKESLHECMNKAMAIKRKRDTFRRAIITYDSLGDKGKTTKDSEEARKLVTDFLNRYVFADEKREDLNTIPTAMLVKALKNYAKDVNNANFAELIKTDINEQVWENTRSYDKFRKPIVHALKKKTEEMTEQDKLTIYEYSIHILHHAAGIEKLSFDSYDNKFTVNMGYLAVHFANLDEAFPDTITKENADLLPYEKHERYMNEASSILSILSGIDNSLFKYLPLEAATSYAYEALGSMTDVEKNKKVLESCIKDAKTIKNMYRLLTEAVESLDRNKIIDSIKSVTGEEQSDLGDIPTTDLIELANRMVNKVQHYDEMSNIYNEYKKALIERPEDYYREVFNDLEEVERKEGLPQNLLLTKKEYGVTYVIKALNPSKISRDAFDGLESETLYELVKNIGIIRYLNESAVIIASEKNQEIKDTVKVRDVLSKLSEADYEAIGMDVKDYDKAVKELNSLKISNDIKAGIEAILKPEVPPKKLSFFDETDVDLKYAVDESSPIGKVQIIKPRGTKKQENKNIIKENPDKINVESKKENWTVDSKILLEVIGNLYFAAAKKPMDMDLVYNSIKKHDGVILDILNYDNKFSKKDPFKELMNGVSELERPFIEGAKQVLYDIAGFYNEILKKDPEYKPGSFVSTKDLEPILEANKPKVDIKKASKILNSVADKAEGEIIKLMYEATYDAFDQIGGMGIPNIFNLDGDKATDKDNLLFAHNNLRYNKEYGQGKFLINLMNDYYRKSSPEDRRFMMSFIIKDFKKNDDRSTEIKKGGEYFASSLKGAGPIMQKLMQGVPEYMVIPELRDAINVVKSDLRPIDDTEVNKVLEQIKDNSKKKISSIKLSDRLGAASVAETFLCTVEGPKLGKKEAVLKILRPDANDRMNREIPLIREMAGSADSSKNVIEELGPVEAGFLAQLSEMEKEFNLKNEAKNCKTGAKKYGDREETVKTVEILDVPMKENYLLMSKAEGITLDRHIKETRRLSQTALMPFEVTEGKTQKSKVTYKLTFDNIGSIMGSYEPLRRQMDASLKYGSFVGKVAEVWTGQALFGSAWNPLTNQNFHHGDLHSGNIMVNKKYATILDYGNATNLHHDKVTHILEMMMSVVLKRADLYVDAFSNLLKMAINEDNDAKNKIKIGYEPLTPEMKEKYRKRLEEIFSTGTQENAGLHIMLSLSTAQNLGIKLPMELQNFSQCQQRLENSLEEIKQATIEVRKSIDTLERMPLDKDITDSCDPLVIFQNHMLMKNNQGKYLFRDYEAASTYLFNQVSYTIKQEITDDIGEITELKNRGKDVSKELDTSLKKHYKPYEALFSTMIGTEYLTLDSFPKKAEEMREWYKQFVDNYKKTGELPLKGRELLGTISAFVLTSVHNEGVLSNYTTKEEIIDLNRKAMQPPFDELAFEKLMAICEADLGFISENVRGINKCVSNSREFTGEEMLNFQNAINSSKMKEKRFVSYFVDQIRDVSEHEKFEQKMKRVFNRHPKLEEEFENYKKAYNAFNNLTLKNSKEEFINARKQFIRCEDQLIDTYTDIAQTYFEEIKKNSDSAFTMKHVMNTDMLPSYVEVIYDVVTKDKNLTNAVKRMDKRIAVEYYTKQKEAEKQLKAEKEKEKEEAKKKADAKKAEDKKENEKKGEVKKTKKEDVKKSKKKGK